MARYRSERDAGRMAVALATQHFFGTELMSGSTRTGRPSGTRKTTQLPPDKMEEIRVMVINKFGRRMSEVDRMLL